MIVETQNLKWRPIRPKDLISVSEIFEDWEHDPKGPITIMDVQRYIAASQSGTAYLAKHNFVPADIDLKNGGKFWHTLVAVDDHDNAIAVWVMRIEENWGVVENILLGQSIRGQGLFAEIIVGMSKYFFEFLGYQAIRFEVASAAAPVFKMSERFNWKRVDDPEKDRLVIFESNMETRTARLAQEGNVEADQKFVVR